MKKLFFVLLLLLFVSARLMAVDYYWVKGSGIWSDLNHWATTSGGTVFHFTVPTANDNVHFDNNSFTGINQVVTITFGGDISNVVCKNMDWTGSNFNPTLFGNSIQKLRIYGSLTLIPSMTYSFSGVVNFEATTSGNTITSGGKTFQNDIIFQGTGGWTLKDDLTTISMMNFTRGSLNLAGNTANCKRFLSDEENVRNLNIAGSLLNIKGNNTSNYSWEVNGTGLTFNSIGSLIQIDDGDQRILHSGAPLHYNNVKLLNGANSNIVGGNSRFNNIWAGDSMANAPDNFNLSSIQFADSIVSYSSIGNILSYDSANYVLIASNLTLINVDTVNNVVSFSEKVIIGKDATIQSNNKIDSLWIYGAATINKNNQIRCDSIFGDATFNGSSNVFGRLVVMGNSYFSGTNKAENCFLMGSARFENINTFGSLYLSPRNIYQFGAGDTVTINNVLSLPGLCTGAIILQSTIQGEQGIIHKSSGAVVGNYLSLHDINADGGAIFTANNSVDLGNNNGWTINTATSLSLYWVGGTGNWDDPAHWSKTSGGEGGACLPTAIDDVYFNTNSFTAAGQTVTINIGDAVCRNMTWKGARYTPTFTGPDVNTLHIYGSLTLMPAMTHSFSGVVYFDAATLGNTLTSGGKTFQNDVVFQGTGEWTLNDSLTAISTVQLTRGSLNTGGETINCKQFLSDEDNIRNLNISASVVRITGNNTTNYSWDVNGTGLTFNSVGSLIVIDGGDQRLRHSGTSQRYYNLKLLNGAKSNIVGGDSRFRVIRAGESSVNAPNNMNLRLVHYADSIISYSSLLSTLSYDSVNYIRTIRNLTLNNGDIAKHLVSFSRKVIVGQDAIIQSNNKIDSLWIYGSATINKNNLIKCDSIFGSATLNGSSNDFGRLVVMGNSRFTGTNKVKYCMLRGNGTFENVNTFDSLYLSPGKIYKFGGGETTTINYILSLPGICTKAIILQSTVADVQGIIHKSSGAVIGSYLSLRDIKAEGGATFTANNSVNLGNNSGWTINTAASLSLYWIGGTGNWDNPAHWSLNSGGAGGACLPTAIDNVYFDAKSFTAVGQTVTINIGDAVCRNMTWSGAKFTPTFTGPVANTLHVYGSLTLIPAMTHGFAGVVYFEAATSDNVIASGGKTFQNDIIFQGTGGWMLQDSLTTTSAVQFTRGNLSTRGNNVNCKRFLSTEGNVRNLNIVGSLVNIKGNNTTNYSWEVNGTGLTFNSIGSLIQIDGGDQRILHSGTPLQYNNVKLLNGTKSNIVGGDSRFNIIQAGDSSANAPGNFNISLMQFADSIVSYSSTGNVLSYDSVNYIRTISNLALNNGDIGNNIVSFSGKMIIGKDATIQSNNKIDSLWIYGAATINKNNQIRCDSIFGDATFNGSSNVFGRLIVMGNSSFTGTNKVEHGELKGSSTFENFNTFDSLYLSPGRLYRIGAADTLKVTRVIRIRGNNCFPLQLQSTVFGQQAILWKPGDIVSGDFLEIRDINAMGGATFYAGNYSTNMGNNTGWIFKNTTGYVFGLGADREICVGESLTTNDFNGAISFVWQDGSTLPYFVITQPGLYWVTATYAQGCSYSDSIYITTKPLPVARITMAEPSICSGGSVKLIAETIGGVLPEKYSWWPSASLNDSSIINPIATPSTTTNYIFSTISGNGCSSSDTIRVNVVPPVLVLLTKIDPVACNSPTGTSTATAEGGLPFIIQSPYNYSWNTTPVQSSATATGLSAGEYVVTATDSLGCIGVGSVIFNDPDPPEDVSLSLSTDTICPGDVAMATASGATLYEFFVNGISQGNASSDNVFPLKGLTPGVHTVSVTGTQTGCTGTSETLSLTVPDNLVAGLNFTMTPTGAVSPGELLTFTAIPTNGGSSPNYQWFVNGKPIHGAISEVFTSKTLTDKDTVCCRMISNAICVVNPEVLSVQHISLAPTITGLASVCEGVIGVTYTTQADMAGYTWVVSSGGTITAGAGTNVITVAWSSAGDQIVMVDYINPNGSTNIYSALQNVTVNPLPVPSISGSFNTCIGGTCVYTTEAAMTNYSWIVSSDGTIIAGAGTNSITVKWTSSGTQTISVNYTNAYGCTARAVPLQNVTVNPLPVPTITGSFNTCIGESNSYTTEAAMSNYTWSVSSGGTIIAGAGTDSLTVKWTSTVAQTISIYYTDTIGCKAGNATLQNVTVNPLPVPTITETENTWLGTNYTYATEPSMTNYTWIVSPGGTISAGGETDSVTIQWLNLGWQTLSVSYIDANGCAAVDVVQNINVVYPPLTITQGFSPNGDGLNDKFYFGGLENYPGSKLVIFTRAGQTVFESQDSVNEWDGTFQQKGSKDPVLVSCGVYYYVLKLGGTNRSIKGFIYVGY